MINIISLSDGPHCVYFSLYGNLLLIRQKLRSMKKSVTTHPIIIEKLLILHNAEKQLMDYLQVIRHKSKSPELIVFLSTLKEVCINHIIKIKIIFNKLNIHAHSATCEAMNGLIRENLLLLAHGHDATSKDAAIINFLQHVNHYKTTAYVWLFAQLSENEKNIEITRLLHETLEEEKKVSQHMVIIEEAIVFSHHSKHAQLL